MATAMVMAIVKLYKGQNVYVFVYVRIIQTVQTMAMVTVMAMVIGIVSRIVIVTVVRTVTVTVVRTVTVTAVRIVTVIVIEFKRIEYFPERAILNYSALKYRDSCAVGSFVSNLDISRLAPQSLRLMIYLNN